MEEQSLKEKTVKGVAWSSIDTFAALGIQFVVGIILARLLSPSEYGVIGLVTVFLAISDVFIQSGFSSALIRKKDCTESDRSTVFFFSVVVSIFFYFFWFLSAPFIAKFYDMPILTSVTRVIALTMIAGAICIVPNAIFATRIDFKTTAKISVSSSVLGGIVGITMAYMGYGVWALVFQSITLQVYRSVMTLIMSKWLPREGFSKQSFRDLFSYGSKLMLSNLLNTIYNNLYTIVIAKLFSAKTLGLYSRAQGYANLPSYYLTTILQRVTFPVLSTIQDDQERLAGAYRRLLKISAYITFPLMMLLCGLSDPLIRWLITDTWEDCIILLQLLCFSMMWYPIHAINLNLLQVKGRSDLFLKLEIIKKIVGVVILFVSAYWGIIGLCVGGIISSIFSLVINTHYTGKMIAVGFWKQMLDLLPIFIASVVAGLLSFFTTLLPIHRHFITLVIGTLAFATFYLIASRLWLSDEYKETLQLLRRK